jgi:hypothetical protein
MENTPKTLKELFANTGIEPTTDENGNTHYHFNAIRKKEPKQVKDLSYWEANAQEDYLHTPISVLRYITELEERMYSDEDLRTAYFSGIKTTGEGWNGEYANGNNPSIEEEFQEEFQEWLKQFKNNLENK